MKSKSINKNTHALVVIIFCLALIVGIVLCLVISNLTQNKSIEINTFQECVDAGNPVAESYPEQCFADGKSFSNPAQSADNIVN